MSIIHLSLSPPIISQNYLPFHLSSYNLSLNPVRNCKVMWGKFAKHAPSVNLRCYSFLGVSRVVGDRFKFRPFELNYCTNLDFPEMGFCIKRLSLFKDEVGDKPNLKGVRPKGFASFVEVELNSSTDCEDDFSVVDEIHELVEEMRREERRAKWRFSQLNNPTGMSPHKYNTLRNRQIKSETKSWQLAASEYRELLVDMCKLNLAPNLPYAKSLFLGWFEPLRDSIIKDQELVRLGKCTAAYGQYFDLLPADMMTIIAMHKLMGLLINGNGYGNAKVVTAACAIGEAIEQEVRIHRFLQKPKRKKGDETKNAADDDVLLKQQQLSKNVENLIKKQKRRQALEIVTSNDELEPWSTEARAKVGSRLIELLIKTAFIQPPASQSAEDFPNIRPAFMHLLKNVGPINRKTSRRYGVIECDPEVIKGLEQTVSFK